MRGESGRNKIAKHFEETHKVKLRVYFVKRGFLQLATSGETSISPQDDFQSHCVAAIARDNSSAGGATTG